MGLDCVGRLNGIFGFALWDEEKQTLIAARDPFGVKPLYWFERDGKVGVASEVGAFLAADLIEPAVDEISLEHFLTWRFTPSPRTMFKGVSRLAAASAPDRGARRGRGPLLPHRPRPEGHRQDRTLSPGDRLSASKTRSGGR